jgi:hypothetical protein
MSVTTLREALLWCTVINYAILIFWCLTVMLKFNWLYDLSARLFKVSLERAYEMNFAGIIFYKAAIIFFNLVPLIALYIVTKST